MSNAYLSSFVMLEMYFFANSKNAVVAEEKICSFFHANAVVVLKEGKNGRNSFVDQKIP